MVSCLSHLLLLHYFLLLLSNILHILLCIPLDSRQGTIGKEKQGRDVRKEKERTARGNTFYGLVVMKGEDWWNGWKQRRRRRNGSDDSIIMEPCRLFIRVAKFFCLTRQQLSNIHKYTNSGHSVNTSQVTHIPVSGPIPSWHRESSLKGRYISAIPDFQRSSNEL